MHLNHPLAPSLVQQRRQLGSTIFGLVLGLTIGIVFAVGLAIWFGKTQSPMVNKLQPKGTLTEAEEKTKNQTWDPNGGLFGKAAPPSLKANDAAIAASAASAAAPGSQAEPKAQSQVVPAPPASVAVVTKAKPSNNVAPDSGDPIADLAKAKAKAKADAATSAPASTAALKPSVTNPTPGTAATTGDSGVYFVQVGAFKLPEDANAQKARLALLGIETKVTEREQSGQTMYRVRAGVFKKIEEAEQVKSRLDKAGFDSVLVKTPR